MYRQTVGWMEGQSDGWMEGQTVGCMEGQTDRRTIGWMEDKARVIVICGGLRLRPWLG